jgi:hypothetical protein
MATGRGAARGAAAPLVAAVLALAALGCGGDEETADTPARTPAPATAPLETAAETTQATTEQTTTEPSGGVGPTDQTTTGSTSSGGDGGGGGGGGGVSPSYDPEQPDSPANDVPPAAGTPQDKFEQYCNQHPGACG